MREQEAREGADLTEERVGLYEQARL